MTNAGAKLYDILEAHKRLFDLDRDDLGSRLLREASLGSYFALMDEEQADGAPLKALSERYREWKEKNFPGRPKGILNFEMAKREHFLGETRITPDQAVVEFGTNDQAKQEAKWFCEGDPSQNRPARPFWGLTEIALQESEKILVKHVNDSF